MSVMRSMLLAASQNKWLRDRASHYRFVRRTVSRFMPGETLDDALSAAQALKKRKIGTVFTHLGENIVDRSEALQVPQHYREVLDRIPQCGLQTEVSVKLTQLGLDLSSDFCFDNLKSILLRAEKTSTVWVDMEASNYVDATLEIYRRALKEFPNTGLCLQAYLYRTKDDIAKLVQVNGFENLTNALARGNFGDRGERQHGDGDIDAWRKGGRSSDLDDGAVHAGIHGEK
jgi:proline dehydrogenase